MQKEESLIRIGIVQNIAGRPSQPQERRYLDCNRRILAIIDDYTKRETLQYLEFESSCT